MGHEFSYKKYQYGKKIHFWFEPNISPTTAGIDSGMTVTFFRQGNIANN